VSGSPADAENGDDAQELDDAESTIPPNIEVRIVRAEYDDSALCRASCGMGVGVRVFRVSTLFGSIRGLRFAVVDVCGTIRMAIDAEGDE